MGSEGEARGKRESETAPHHVILAVAVLAPLDALLLVLDVAEDPR